MKKLLPRNESRLDRSLRVALGLVLIAGALVVDPLSPWGWIGVIPLLTGLFGSCPIYTLFGLRTCTLERS